MPLKIASRWFERTKMGDGLTLLREPHAHPLLRCNIWHVRGRDRDLLIDTGLGISSLREEISDLVDKPLIALATHVHYDHVGSFHEFDTRLMHPLEEKQMSDYREFCALVTGKIPNDFPDALAEMGMPVEGGALVDAIPFEGFDPATFQTRSTTPTASVDEGDPVRVQLGAVPGFSGVRRRTDFRVDKNTRRVIEAFEGFEDVRSEIVDVAARSDLAGDVVESVEAGREWWLEIRLGSGRRVRLDPEDPRDFDTEIRLRVLDSDH